MSLNYEEASEIYEKIFKHMPTKQEVRSFLFGYELGYKNGKEDAEENL